MNVFSSEKIRFWFLWKFRSFKKQVLFSKRFWAIAALNRDFLERLQFFSHIFLNILDAVETKIFFLCLCCAIFVIFWHGLFRTRIWASGMERRMPSWFITWGLPDRGRFFTDSKAFKRCSTRWTAILLNLKTSRNKVDILILLGSSRRQIVYMYYSAIY